MDLEQYLASSLQVRRGDGGDRTVTIGDVVGAAANTLGGAHYDEEIELEIDSLRDQVFIGSTVLDRILLGLADVVVGLSRQVVQVLLSSIAS